MKNLQKNIADLLEKRKIKPFKGWGQNFLIDESVLSKIIKAAELKKSDVVLEIGPGSGVLTKELAKKARRVIAVEKDRKMVEILKEKLKAFKNVKIIEGDVLKFEIIKLFKNLKATPRGVRLAGSKIKNYKIVANLPYYIASPVIRMFLESKTPPKLMVLMVQKEVGQRICAKPLLLRRTCLPDRQGFGGQAKMNLLAVSVQFYANPEIISYVPKRSFWPRPKVDAAIIKIRPVGDYRKQISPELFFKTIKAGFSHPRKQILNNLSSGLGLDKKTGFAWLKRAGVDPRKRPEALTISDWIKLAGSLA